MVTLKAPLTQADYYGAGHVQPDRWMSPFVHPDDCDHERDDDEPNALCSQCCPCDLCGSDRYETSQDEEVTT